MAASGRILLIDVSRCTPSHRDQAAGATRDDPCSLLVCVSTLTRCQKEHLFICPTCWPQEAKAQGDFLLVGIHTDEDVQKRRGVHLPIMNLHERALSVLACKYADEVVIGAPTVITEDIITTFNISVVVRGSISETNPQGEQVRG